METAPVPPPTYKLLEQLPAGIPGALIWGALYILLAIFAIYSLILLYHWLRYGRGYPLTWVAMVVYFGVSAALIASMITSAVILI